MNEEITRYRTNGFEIRADIEPDEISNYEPYEDQLPRPDPLQEPDFAESYHQMRDAYYRGEWEWVGVRVKAYAILEHDIIKLGEASVWAVCSLDTESIRHEIVPDLASEALEEAHQKLEQIRNIANAYH